MSMTKQDKLRLRRRYDQAVVREEDLRIAADDFRRELAAIDERFDRKRAAYFRANIEQLEKDLIEAQEQVDELRREVRAAGVPPAEPIHPGGGAAAILDRDKHNKPRQWDQGGTIGSREAEWASPEVPGSRRHR